MSKFKNILNQPAIKHLPDDSTDMWDFYLATPDNLEEK